LTGAVSAHLATLSNRLRLSPAEGRAHGSRSVNREARRANSLSKHGRPSAPRLGKPAELSLQRAITGPGESFEHWQAAGRPRAAPKARCVSGSTCRTAHPRRRSSSSTQSRTSASQWAFSITPSTCASVTASGARAPSIVRRSCRTVEGSSLRNHGGR
jgi:hypothetical protein